MKAFIEYDDITQDFVAMTEKGCVAYAPKPSQLTAKMIELGYKRLDTLEWEKPDAE